MALSLRWLIGTYFTTKINLATFPKIKRKKERSRAKVRSSKNLYPSINCGFLGNKCIDMLAVLCFHSRGQHLCKFIGTKESVHIRKEFNSDRTDLGHRHGRRFFVLGHKYGRHDVMRKHTVHNSNLSFPLRI